MLYASRLSVGVQVGVEIGVRVGVQVGSKLGSSWVLSGWVWFTRDKVWIYWDQINLLQDRKACFLDAPWNLAECGVAGCGFRKRKKKKKKRNKQKQTKQKTKMTNGSLGHSLVVAVMRAYTILLRFMFKLNDYYHMVCNFFWRWGCLVYY